MNNTSTGWSDMAIKGHSARSMSLGRPPNMRNPNNVREHEPTMFNMRENIRNSIQYKGRPGYNSLYPITNDRGAPMGINASFSVSQGIIEPQSACNNSLNGFYLGSGNIETVGDEEPTFPMIKQKVMSSIPESREKTGRTNSVQENSVGVVMSNGNGEVGVQDLKNNEIIMRNQAMLRNYKPRGNWTPIARKRRDKEVSGGENSFQLKEKTVVGEEFTVFPNTEKNGKRAPDLVLKQLAMYLTQNTENMELGFQGGLRLLEDHLNMKTPAGKSTRSSSCVRNSSSNRKGTENKERTGDTIKRTILQNKVPYGARKNANVRSKYADIPVKNNVPVASPRTAGVVHQIADVYKKQFAGEQKEPKTQNNKQASHSVENKPIVDKNKVKGSNLLKQAGFSGRSRGLQLEDTERGLVYEGGPRVRTPRLKNESPLLNSNKLIRGLYRVKDSARSLDARSEGDSCNEEDLKANSMTMVNESKEIGGRKSSREKESVSRRLYSATPRKGTSRGYRERLNFSATQTSSFNAKMNKIAIQGITKGWEESKRRIETGKVKDASFIQFETNGKSPILPKTKGALFGTAERGSVFGGRARTPGPGKYNVHSGLKPAAFSFGQDKKLDMAGLPLVEEVNKMLDSARYYK